MTAVAVALAAGGAQAAGAGDETAAPPIDSSITMFYYDDLAAPEAFYGGLLGLEKTFEEDWVKIYKVTETASVGLVRPGGEGAYHTTQAKNAVMLSIVTSDVEAWYRRLKAAEVKFIKDIENPDVPIRAFLVEDPGGYTVEFFQWQDEE